MSAYSKDDNLMLWLPMTAGSGTSVNDYSGKGHDGTITGANWIKIPYMGSYALDFNGTSDNVIVSASTDFDFGTTTDFSFLAWAKPNNTTGFNYIMDKQQNSSPFGGFFMRFDNTTGYVTIGIDGTGTPAFLNLTDSTNHTGNWTFIVGTCDRDIGSNNFKLYVDGEFITAGTESLDVSSAGTTLKIGVNRSGSAYYMDGQIELIKIWKGKVLSAEEIKAIYRDTYRR